MAFSTRVWSGLALAAFWASTGSAAAPKTEKEKAPEFADVTQKVDVQFIEGLRSPDETTHEVLVVLKNKSGSLLKGPLAVVFDGKQGTEFSFDWYTDTLTDGRQYHGLVDIDDELPAKQSSRRRKLYLKTAAAVDEAHRKGFQVPLRVIQLSPEHVESKKPVDEEVAGKKYDRQEFDRVKEIQERAANHFLSTKAGVAGVFLCEDANGDLNIQVMAGRRGVAREIPGSFEGVPIQTDVTGMFHIGGAGVAPAAGGGQAPTLAAGKNQTQAARLSAFRQSRIDRPICIGVSAFNITDVCASGTVGCRVKDRAGNLYALSNNHVFAELTGFDGAGDPTGGALVGDDINQPSPGDTIVPACDKTVANFLGDLADWEPYRFALSNEVQDFVNAPVNVIDAAIARVSSLDMGVAAPDDTYGTPSTLNVAASIGLKIQKMGRTTGWTKGQISGINGILILDAGGIYARFERAIATSVRTSGIFGIPGDSGSLVVTQDGNRPVALLYGGSSAGSLFCPISVVCDRFNIVIDDGGTSFVGGHSGRIGTAIGPVRRGIRR